MNNRLAKEEMALLLPNSLTYSSVSTERAILASRAAGGKPRSIVSVLTGMVYEAMQAPRRRRVLNELNRLTDRELADIGIHRAELPRVFDPAFAEARHRDAA